LTTFIVELWNLWALRTVLQRVSELSTIINTMVDNDDYVDLEGVMGPEFPELCDKFNDCVFIGHSFVRQFKDWLQSAKNPFGNQLCLRSVNGLEFLIAYTVPQMYKLISTGSRNLISGAKTVVVDIGGNDLSDSACDEAVLLEMILALIRVIRSINPECTLIVLQLLHRRHLYKKCYCVQRRRRYGTCCSEESVEAYNKKVDNVNKLLKARLPKVPKTKYWCHKALWSDTKFAKLYNADGLHLSALGMLKYARSVRGAILHATKSA
jgi:lysophospholipase L1-like esterase